MKVLRAIGRRVSGIARLTGLSAWHGLIGFYHSDNLSYAASIAYYALLSLFPFLLLAFTLLGRAAADPQTADGRLRIRSAILSEAVRLRHDGSSTPFSSAIRHSASRELWRWSGARSGFFSAISTAVNHAWGVERQRSFWKHRLFSFLMLGIAGLILLVALLPDQREPPGRHVLVCRCAGKLSRFGGPAKPRRSLCHHPLFSFSSSASSLHRAEHEGAISGRLGPARWSPDCCGRGPRGLFLVRPGHVAASHGSTDRSQW